VAKILLHHDGDTVVLSPELLKRLKEDRTAPEEAISQTAMMVGIYSVLVKPPDSGFDEADIAILQGATTVLTQRGIKPNPPLAHLDPLLVREYADL
jgi:hypothetical protein